MLPHSYIFDSSVFPCFFHLSDSNSAIPPPGPRVLGGVRCFTRASALTVLHCSYLDDRRAQGPTLACTDGHEARKRARGAEAKGERGGELSVEA